MSELGRLVVLRRPLRTVLALALTGALLLPLSARASAQGPRLASGAPSVVEVVAHTAVHSPTGVGPGTSADARAGAPTGVTDVAGMLAALVLLVASANLTGMLLAGTLLARGRHPRRTGPGAHPEGP